MLNLVEFHESASDRGARADYGIYTVGKLPGCTSTLLTLRGRAGYTGKKPSFF
jgi:hypothetical protein